MMQCDRVRNILYSQKKVQKMHIAQTISTDDLLTLAMNIATGKRRIGYPTGQHLSCFSPPEFQSAIISNAHKQTSFRKKSTIKNPTGMSPKGTNTRSICFVPKFESSIV